MTPRFTPIQPFKLSATIVIGLLCCIPAAAQNEEEEARRIAAAAIRIGAIDYLTDRDFKLDGEEIVVTARAIDPKEHVKIDLREFNLLPGRVDLKAKIDARFRFEGKVTVEDNRSDVRGEANIGQIVTIEARYWTDDRGLHVDARATAIKFSVKIHELVPEEAAGGKKALAKLALKQLARQRTELLREFNDWQAEYQRRMR